MIAAFLLTLVLQSAPQELRTGISGTVVNARTGEPLPDVRVTLGRTDMPLGVLRQFAANATPGEGVSAELITAMVSSFEAAALDPDAPSDLSERSAILRALPLDKILEIRVLPPGDPVVILKSALPVLSDSRGRFEFKDLDPGIYRLIFSADGFANGEYGQRTISGPGFPLTLTAGKPRTDLALKLVPTGAISGRILDEWGDAAVGIPIQLFRFSYDQTGERKLQLAAATVTDDRGEYRLFYLVPGSYYVCAGHQIGQTQVPGGSFMGNERSPNSGYVSLNLQPRTYAPSYFPGVTDPNHAHAIEVQPGSDVKGIDVSVGIQRTYRVRGKIIDSATRLPPNDVDLNLAVQSDDLFLRSPSSFLHKPVYRVADGSFEISNASPGPYRITAVGGSGVPYVPEPPGLTPEEGAERRDARTAAERERPMASAAIILENSDVEGIALILAKGRSIPVHLRVEAKKNKGENQATKTDPTLGVMIELKPPGTSRRVFSMSDPMHERNRKDGTSRIDNVLPDDYRIYVNGIPEGFYLKELRFGNLDVQNGRLKIGEGDAGPFDVVLSPNVGKIEGTVSNSGSQPSPGAQVVLIPLENRERTELFRTAVSDSAGRFTIPDVAPGEYIVAAWETLEPFGFYDPAAIRQAEEKGKPLRVSESALQVVTVDSIQ